MSIKKRGDIWWVDITAPNGSRVRHSAKTKVKKEAQEYHDRLKTELWRVHQVGETPKFSWKETIVRWIQENQEKTSLKDDIQQLRILDTWLKDVQLHQIDRSLVDTITLERRAQGKKPATVNRMLATLSSILNRAFKQWEWLDKVPHIPKLKLGEPPVRWITKAEAHRLLSVLSEHHAAMAGFTLATGLREMNVVLLKWSQIDLSRRTAWIDATNTKNKRALAVPLNDNAISILKSQIGKNDTYVFTYRGNPLNGANTRAWRKGLKRAGIENFRWHDLRHTWASWHVQNGTPLPVLKELGGWRSMDMVMRYAHLSSSHLVAHTSAVSLNNSIDGTITAQLENFN